MSSSAQLELDFRLRRIVDVARLLPALTARNGADERARLVRALEQDEPLEPRWELQRRRVEPQVWRMLADARLLAEESVARTLYLARFEELELELHMIESLGDARTIRRMAAHHFGTGSETIRVDTEEISLRRVADRMLTELSPEPEERVVPADAPSGPSLAGIVRALARAAGLEIEVKVEPRLVANAAAGERTVYVAARTFGRREAQRLAVHEVLGHLVAAANGRAQPLGILAAGTAGSFGDQEGLALFLEERAGLMDGSRLRTLAARVWITARLHDGARFGDSVRELHRVHGFEPTEAVALGERAYRGGGVARDACYLRGWMNVRGAVGTGEVRLDELRSGKVGVADVPALRGLLAAGVIRPPLYRPETPKGTAPVAAQPTPSFLRSAVATVEGTSASTSPPSRAASRMMFEET